jgi:polar amino acid transport system substrate-binding protein
MKKLPLIGLMSCCIFLILSCSDNSTSPKKGQDMETPKTVATECQLNMGWDPWEPYQYLTPDDEVRGLEIDLINAIAHEAGCNINFVQKSWMKLLHGIRSGSIDMLAGASKTESREQFAYFSDDYRHESFILYVRAGESDKYANKSLRDLLDGEFKLGVTEDYIYGQKVNELQDDPAYKGKFVYVPMTEVNYYNLLQNQIDGFLEDPFVAAFTIKRKGLQGQIEAHPLEIHSGSVAMMFSKKTVDEKTVIAFNQALDRLQKNGEYQKILTKYRH